MKKKTSLTETDKYIHRAILLSFFTIAYNLIEGVVSIGFGISDGSVSLAGFGGDSLIEVGSATLVLWRFRGETENSPHLSIDRERRATFGIGVLFLLLATVTILASCFQLLAKSHPDTTLPGFIIAALSLSFMFYLWSAKKKVARKLDSSTVMKDANCSLACIKLSVVLLIGSTLYLLFPALWWVDSLAGLVLALIISTEGYEIIVETRKPDFAGGCGCS